MTHKPYRQDYLNELYNQFFCDDISLYLKEDAVGTPPWDILSSADIKALKNLAEDESQESRIRLLACRQLALTDDPLTEKILLGVIIEVAMDKGLDTLAVYADGTARLIGQLENLMIWEQRTAESDKLVNELFRLSREVVTKIGPWTEQRLAPPPNENIRLNFLVSDGYYFGQGPLQTLSTDAMGGPVIAAATDIFAYLVTHGNIAT